MRQVSADFDSSLCNVKAELLRRDDRSPCKMAARQRLQSLPDNRLYSTTSRSLHVSIILLFVCEFCSYNVYIFFFLGLADSYINLNIRCMCVHCLDTVTDYSK